MNLSSEDIEKYDLNLSGLVLLEYLYKYSPKVDGAAVTVLEVLMEDLPLVVPAKRTLFNDIKRLKESGLVSEIDDDQLKAKCVIEKRARKEKVAYEGIMCEWCKEDVMTTDNHHYPIRESKGGDQVVRICPNCHRLFHSLRVFELNAPFVDQLDILDRVTP